MSYTPINWQTGDQITAEKMNKMDNGWSVSSALQTFYDGDITTTDANNREALITSSAEFATASELKVTLNNVEYNLTGFDDGGYWTWGAPYGDFSQYSFSIYISNENTAATFVSQTAGTYALKIEANGTSVETSADFQSAVKSVAGDSSNSPLQLIPNVTQYDDARDAFDAGRLIYFFTEEDSVKKCFFVNVVSLTCVITPTSSTFEARFPRDGGAFYINPL